MIQTLLLLAALFLLACVIRGLVWVIARWLGPPPPPPFGRA
jgi:hypothetical protein